MKMEASSSNDMMEVHAAWLAAGAQGDVETMRNLWSQYPEWLDLNRVRPLVSDSRARRQAKFCSWGSFHLDTIGASAIHTAAWEGSLDIMRFLLESGQDPDVGDDSGLTPIMVAILRLNLMTMRCVFRDGVAVRRNTVIDCRQEQEQQVQILLKEIKLLLQFGATVDARSKDGKTALHCSTGDDAYEVAKFLLDTDAVRDAQDELGRTPLFYCIEEDGLLVTDMLLSRGANIDLDDKDGISPLKLVLQRKNLSVLQLFLNHYQCVETSTRRDFGTAILLQAVEYRAEDVVRYIVENEYASVVVRNEKGETPIHRAIKQNNPTLIELLNDLDPAGDNLTATTDELETPAHYAARYGSRRTVEMLLQCLTSVYADLQDHGTANPLNTVNKQGETSLFVTVTVRHAEDIQDMKAKLFLDHGARLFLPASLTLQLTRGGPSRLVFPVKVQNCLRLWLIKEGERSDEPEDEDDTDNTAVEALGELCMYWMSAVSCVDPWASLLSIIICTGYAHDIVPLLVEFPIQRWALPALLNHLEKYARHQLNHRLLLQLHAELQEACEVGSS
ncbi:Ankyrin-3 [Phytophthora citrophthora]|uniref:Ankyrin-3 n=1 Tax=Phytophthora citrophthora TaxID=4793 RepID=A0AAD9GHZ8_9STRA|nr:Ankyrin-3 [Phytophthora citrophthora]